MRIKEIRKARGMTQADVAASLSIPVRTYQNYEREVNDPDMDILCRIADLLDTRLDYMVGLVDVDHGTIAIENDDEKRLIDQFRLLNSTEKVAIMAAIDGIISSK